MLNFIAWYITITLLGLLTFPLAYRLLPALADKGYALSRSLGLLLWGFVFWLSVSLGLSQNNPGGLLLALAVLVGLSLWANWNADRGPSTTDDSLDTEHAKRNTDGIVSSLSSILQWLKLNLGYVISVEILFLLAFGVWAYVRANNPDLTGTEKPMEIAFINAIIHSPTFPPHDPWLSGYAISYYYFGYVMTAMLAEITATVGSMAFNLMLALIFSLSAIGAYGLLYNLLKAYWTSNDGRRTTDNTSPESNHPRSIVYGLRSIVGAFLAPLFLVILGNWEGLLDVMHSLGIGWTPSPDGSMAASPFWTWLNMKDLSDAPAQPFGLAPANFRFWWWWRASRVVHDYDFRGNFIEVIDEFPFFSYLLGDLHPHVLAMPFGLLAGALALNLYLGGWKGETDLPFGLKLPLRREGFALLAVVLGGLAFLNTWDFPIYLALVCGAVLLVLAQELGWSWDLLERFLTFSIPLAVLSIVLYLPFYIGFSSQAGGLLPNVIFPTRGAYLWIMFGGLLVPIFCFLVYLRNKQKADWINGFTLAIGLVVLLWAASTAMAVVAAQTEAGQQLITSQGVSSTWEALREATGRRLAFSAGLLTLALLIGGATAYLTVEKDKGSEGDVGNPNQAPSPILFVVMFILFGGLLVLAPEFVYLRDQFGSRMNTIFKFYYEAWALWAIAAAFAAVVMLSELRGWLSRLLFSATIVLLVAIGLLYPIFSVPSKTNNFSPSGGPTLDGAAYLIQGSPDDYQAIQFLAQAAPGTVAEAVGGSYQDSFGVVATYSGQPTVLGWPGHESQWRGGATEIGSREADMRMLYSTRDWGQAQTILKQYSIRYVYIGPMERQTYPVSDDKFTKNLARIYNQGQVSIYIVP